MTTVLEQDELEHVHDAELLRRWRSGDVVAGEALAGRYYASIYRFFSNKAEEAVEDLTQRTFIACLESRGSLQKSASFRAYLFAIASHELSHYRRTTFREGRKRASYEGEVAMDTLPGSPSSVVGVRQEQRVLLAALRQLPLESQIALELYYWEGMSVGEIGEVLGMPDGTVKSRLFRARSALREHIESRDLPAKLKFSTISNLEGWARRLRDELPEIAETDASRESRTSSQAPPQRTGGGAEASASLGG